MKESTDSRENYGALYVALLTSCVLVAGEVQLFELSFVSPVVGANAHCEMRHNAFPYRAAARAENQNATDYSRVV